MSPSKQRPFASNPRIVPSMGCQIFTDGSVRGGIENGDAGLVVLSQDVPVHEWHAPTCTHSSSFQEENAVLKEAIQWLSSILSWASAIIICDSKSLVQAISNTKSAHLSVIKLQAAAAVLAMSKFILIVWTPGHCGLSGNELAYYQAKLGAAETQPNNALDTATFWISPDAHVAPYHPNTSDWRRCIRLSLMSKAKRPLPRLNAPTWLASAVVITLLKDAGSILWESPRKPSADCVARMSNRQNSYGYDVRRSWWNDTIATFAKQLTNSSAFHTQL